MLLTLPSDALSRQFVGINISLPQKESSIKNKARSFHAFTIGTIGFLLPAEMISEIAENVAYCQLPNTNTVLYGMANLRGNIIPIFDLHAQFNIESKAKNNRKVLIIGEGRDAAAVLIDELPIRLIISPEDKISGIPPLENELQQHVKTCYHAKEKTWLDLDMPALFSTLSQFI